MKEIYDSVKERFIKYARINTMSDSSSTTSPSTMRQFDLAKVLLAELEEIGVQGLELTDECCIYGYIPATVGDSSGNTSDKLAKESSEIPAVGFIAHMDTSQDAPSDNVKPWVYENYPGGNVTLNEEQGIVLEVEKFPIIDKYVGHDLIFSDGTTLLGGDDKAAVASLVTAAEYLLEHQEIPHGKICVGFTPDEEIGRGTDNFGIERFGADIAYTIDGEGCGGVYDETFNAWEAQLTIHGINVHPGTAKGVMKNALEIATEFVGMLPPDRPHNTEGREGYYHPHVLNATVEGAVLRCLIRDHDLTKYYERKQVIEDLVGELNAKYGAETIELEWVCQYFNMGEIIKTVPYMIPYAQEAVRRCGIEPFMIAFRGGTDGSILSQKGLPCPNITAGYENAHGRFEFVSIDAMVKNVEILTELCKIYAEK